jgi:membrane protease subunit (stomatin/prohibitin family)
MGDEMDEEDMQNQELQHYLEIGAITMEGLDENGEFIFAIQEKAKEVAPQLWEAHHEYVDKSLMRLYELDLLQVEYDENLQATFHLSEEGKILAKEMGLVDIDMPDVPNN